MMDLMMLNKKKKRKDFSDSDETRYKQEYGNNCFLCETEFKLYKSKAGNIEFYKNNDHWDNIPSNNDYGNLRFLCLNCHEYKTRIQKRGELSDNVKNCDYGDYPLKSI